MKKWQEKALRTALGIPRRGFKLVAAFQVEEFGDPHAILERAKRELLEALDAKRQEVERIMAAETPAQLRLVKE